jgi:hypothetical protein
MESATYDSFLPPHLSLHRQVGVQKDLVRGRGRSKSCRLLCSTRVPGSHDRQGIETARR